MKTIQTPWPNLRLYARDCGEIDPYNARNAALFRGEAAFAPDIEGWKRWSQPSPEPRLDAEFEPILLASIAHQAPQINAMARALAEEIIAANPGHNRRFSSRFCARARQLAPYWRRF